jgi:hypothetical protein
VRLFRARRIADHTGFEGDRAKSRHSHANERTLGGTSSLKTSVEEVSQEIDAGERCDNVVRRNAGSMSNGTEITYSTSGAYDRVLQVQSYRFTCRVESAGQIPTGHYECSNENY